MAIDPTERHIRELLHDRPCTPDDLHREFLGEMAVWDEDSQPPPDPDERTDPGDEDEERDDEEDHDG